MKIINKLTLRYLKENKKRTILTILCIAVSVTMISCVGIAFHSGKQFYKEYTEKTVGDYHYTFVTGNDRIHRVMEILEKDDEIKEYYFSNTDSYFNDQNIKNSHELSIKRGDSFYYQKKNFQDLLIEGRLPKNPNEIVINKDYLTDIHHPLTIGSHITLYNLGRDNKMKEYTFKIVGFMNKYEGRGHLNPSFEALSYIDFNDIDAAYTIYIQDKDISANIFKHAEEYNDKENFTAPLYNSSYLAFQDVFEENSKSSFLVVYNLVAVILVIIMIISYFIIYQAFNLSTNDRVQYLGMLSSVGATPKQKKRSVYFEGLLLSLIGIPLGIIIAFIGLSITFMFINQLNMLKEIGVTIHTAISLKYLGIVIGISLLTIFVSLYIPARRISKISVIDALRKSDEIKVKKKKLKTNFIMKRFSSISWQLAMKNYKRQGRRSRVIVFSLVLSMIAFISVFSFGNQMSKQADLAKQYNDYDIEMTLAGNEKLMNDLHQFLDHNDKVDYYYYDTQLYNCYSEIDKSYFNIPLEETGFFINEDQTIDITIIGLSQQQMKKVCEKNDIEYKDNMGIIYDSGIYKKMDKNFISKLVYKEYIDVGDKSEEKEHILPILDELVLTHDNAMKYDGNLAIYVPIENVLSIDKESYHNIDYYIYSDEYNELAKDLDNAGYSYDNYADEVQQQRDLFLIIEIFIYGFVLIMILFTILNIINMMSASIEKRKKEFGMMLSMGMSPKGIQRMIMYESLIYGIKTLIYGMPICIFVEWVMYKQMNIEDYVFRVSYIAYLISFVVIMFVMLVTFQTGLNKLKKQNIIETLKDDM